MVEIVVEPLAWHRAHVPLIARWFEQEWPEWYGPAGPGSALDDLAAYAESDTALPLGLVALRQGEPVGVAALKADSVDALKGLGPWAAAGIVPPSLRRLGIGERLLSALVERAHAMGYPMLYCGTATSASLLRRAGWEYMKSTEQGGHVLEVFRTRT